MTKLLAACATVGLILGLTGCSAALEATQAPLLDKPNAAADAAAQSDLTNAKFAVIAYVTTNGSMPTTSSAIAEFGYAQSTGVGPLTITGTSQSDFCVQTTSSSGTTFHVTATTSPTTGGC
jgi:type IV pilus assembly protein PilA